MKSAPSARVLGFGLFTPELPNVEAWVKHARVEPAAKLDARALDRQCKRRASYFAKSMALAFAEAVEGVEVDLSNVATVFGSALGETDIMLKLLTQMVNGEDDFSPMLFAVSVHNAASGLVSISTKNRAFTTSMAADFDTPAMALLEAIGASASLGVPAIVVCGDEAAPAGIVPDDKDFGHVAAALVIDASGTTEGGLASLSDLSLAPATLEPPEVEPRLTRNAQAGLLDLVDALARGRQGRLRLDRGRGHGWTVEIGPT